MAGGALARSDGPYCLAGVAGFAWLTAVPVILIVMALETHLMIVLLTGAITGVGLRLPIRQAAP